MGADNQQERLVGLDFLAGLIVGEGSFSLGVYRSPRMAIKPIFALKMKDRETVELAARSLKSHGVEAPLRYEAGRDMWKIDCRGLRRVKPITDMFIPLLTGDKQKAAMIVDEFITRRLSSNHVWDGYSEADIDCIARLREVNGVKNGRKVPLDILRDCMLRSGRRRA